MYGKGCAKVCAVKIKLQRSYCDLAIDRMPTFCVFELFCGISLIDWHMFVSSDHLMFLNLALEEASQVQH